MTEPTELLPCPFCGGINIIHCCHHMYCHACGADGPDADSQCESEAIAAWNKRTPQPTQAQAGAVPLTDEPDCGGESCDCRSYCKKEGGQHGL